MIQMLNAKLLCDCVAASHGLVTGPFLTLGELTHTFAHKHTGRGHVCGGGMGLRGNLRPVRGLGRGGQEGFSWRGTKGANLEQNKVYINSDKLTAEQISKSKATGVKLRSGQMSASPVSVLANISS